MTLPLFKGKEKERAILLRPVYVFPFVEVAANRAAILRACEWRIRDRREGITCLKASMAQEAKSIAVKFVRAAFGDDVYDAAGRATKLRRKRIRHDLKLLHGFLAHRGTRSVD